MYYNSYPLVIDKQIQEDILTSAKDKLLKLVDDYNLDESCILVEESPNIKISLLEKAKELNVDAIYLNGHKHNIVGRLGSVADYIINTSECDVIILK